MRRLPATGCCPGQGCFPFGDAILLPLAIPGGASCDLPRAWSLFFPKTGSLLERGSRFFSRGDFSFMQGLLLVDQPGKVSFSRWVFFQQPPPSPGHPPTPRSLSPLTRRPSLHPSPPPIAFALFLKRPSFPSGLPLSHRYCRVKNGYKSGTLYSNLFPLWLGPYHFRIPHKWLFLSRSYVDSGSLNSRAIMDPPSFFI